MSRTRSSVPDDAEGTDFLNTDFSSVKNTHEIKDAVNNVIGHHGGEKPKQRTPEYRAMLRNEMLNVLVMAARLTKTSKRTVLTSASLGGPFKSIIRWLTSRYGCNAPNPIERRMVIRLRKYDPAGWYRIWERRLKQILYLDN